MNETCKHCGKRIYWISDLGLWYHWATIDTLYCSATVIEPATQVTA